MNFLSFSTSIHLENNSWTDDRSKQKKVQFVTKNMCSLYFYMRQGVSHRPTLKLRQLTNVIPNLSSFCTSLFVAQVPPKIKWGKVKKKNVLGMRWSILTIYNREVLCFSCTTCVYEPVNTKLSNSFSWETWQPPVKEGEQGETRPHANQLFISPVKHNQTRQVK